MSTYNHITTAAIAALVTTASAASANAAELKPFARAELAYTDTGYDASLFQPEGFELGGSFTFGVLFNQKHEISLTTGFTQWESPGNVLAGVFDVNDEVEQIPLLLNYRYHFNVTDKLILNLGPTVGFIHEKLVSNVNFNAGVPGLRPVGSYSETDWKAAVGGTVGTDYRLNDRWTLSASAQVLRVDDSAYQGNGTAGKLRTYDSATRVGFTLGVSYTW